MSPKDEKTLGMFYGVATFTMWGLFPVYFKLLEHVSALEILAHRIIWSVAFLYIILKYKNRIKNIKKYFYHTKTIKMLFLASFFITSNWGIYIYAVSTDRILDTSLGYLINPLFSMLLGAIILKERLSSAAKVSVFLVFFAVALQIYSLGKLPYISISLPISFAIYGLIKKQLGLPSLESLFIETIFMFPVALCYVFYFGFTYKSSLNLNIDGFLLIFSGLVTILPLLSFNLASQKLRLSTMGFLQYISPTIGILLAVFIYHENLDIYNMISFGIIWLSLIIVSIDGILRRKND